MNKILKNISRITGGLGLAAILVGNSSSSAVERNRNIAVDSTSRKTELVKDIPSSCGNLIEKDSLRVSSGPYVPIVFQDEERGIAQLENLARQSKVEDGWIYFPEKKLWVDVGQGVIEVDLEKDDPRGSLGIMMNSRCLIETKTKYRVYHIHPKKVLSELVESSSKRESPEPDERFKQMNKEILQQQPSSSDLSTIGIINLARAVRNPYSTEEIESRIVFDGGITKVRVASDPNYVRLAQVIGLGIEKNSSLQFVADYEMEMAQLFNEYSIGVFREHWGKIRTREDLARVVEQASSFGPYTVSVSFFKKNSGQRLISKP